MKFHTLILRHALIIMLGCLAVACSSNNVYVKIHQTNTQKWDAFSPALFNFKPLKPPHNIFVVWRTDADQLQNIDVAIRTTTLSDGKYFLDTLSLSPQSSTQIRRSGNLCDLSLGYCINADFTATDSLVQVEISPLSPVQGVHYIGIEVSNATFPKN